MEQPKNLLSNLRDPSNKRDEQGDWPVMTLMIPSLANPTLTTGLFPQKIVGSRWNVILLWMNVASLQHQPKRRYHPKEYPIHVFQLFPVARAERKPTVMNRF